MKLEFVDDQPIVLGLKALAQLLVERDDIRLDYGQRIGDCVLDGGTFKVYIVSAPPEFKFATEFTLADLRDTLTGCTFCTWAEDEDGNDVLACFG